MNYIFITYSHVLLDVRALLLTLLDGFDISPLPARHSLAFSVFSSELLLSHCISI